MMATTEDAALDLAVDGGWDRAAEFERHRPLLFSLAYRMLGSIADAEDIVQEAYLRWQRAAPAEVESPRNYLCTIATRLCINQVQSARARREEYVGPWLPEPLVSPLEEDPLERMQLAESLSMAFLLLLERLSETERAVFLLREVFSFDYAEVARIVGRTTVATRQIAKRARDRLGGGAARFTASRPEAERLARRFVDACTRGDMASLHDILAEDIVSWNDGGGRMSAARKLVRGRERVARLYLGLFRKWPPATIQFVHVNRQPGFLVRAHDGRLVVLSFAFGNGRIEGVFAVMNPEKLRRVPPLV